jgi:PD-(D/E)XK nuclease superfamily
MIDVTQYVAGSAIEIATSRAPFDATLGGRMDHWSASALTLEHRCPRAFQERYLFGKRERPAEAPVIGSAVHAGIEFNFAQKIISHEDVPVHELLAWYDDVGFESVIEHEQERAGVEILWDTSAEQARPRGKIMLGCYRNEVAPRIQPTGVEGSFSIDLGLDLPVVGRYDVERVESTIDVKTGKRKQTTPKPHWRIQAGIYGEATGKPIEFHSVTATERNTVNVVTPLESPALLVAPTDNERARMRIDLRTIVAEASLYLELFGDEPWPTYGTQHDWACSYCGFRKDCPAWEHELR